jgi:6-O-methylguanine DNA methyltransferase, DNA binding domain
MANDDRTAKTDVAGGRMIGARRDSGPTARRKKASSTSPWRDKLERSNGLPKVVPIAGKMQRRWGEGTVVIPAPREVDEIMKSVPKGKLITIQEIRSALAERHGATIGCPLTVGIFAWIAAHTALEDARSGRKKVTPYWRTLKSGGYLNEKYPGGSDAQRARLEAEGHTVVAAGKKLAVAEYEQAIFRPPAEK